MNTLIIGPSGSGKDSLIKSLISLLPKEFTKLVSDTTRKKRTGEIEGYNYNYVSNKKFDNDDHFNEIEFSGNRYGFSKEEIKSKIHEYNTNCLIIVEPKGIKPFVDLFEKDGLDYQITFIDVSKEILMKRMSKRGDNKDEIEKRLNNDSTYFDKSRIDYNILLDGDKSMNEVLNEFICKNKLL